MIRVEIEEIIARPIDDVFARLADIGSYPEWMPKTGLFLTCTQDDEGSVGVGTSYTEKTRLGTIRGEVVSFVRPKRLVFRYVLRLGRKTVMQGSPGYTLEPAGESTRVHQADEGSVQLADVRLDQVSVQVIGLAVRGGAPYGMA
jgi:uncharacterized protein YndB with AHSA1/START domain